MDFSFDVATFMPTLALITLLAFALFALFDKKKTEERRADPDAPKSTLAEDAANTRTEQDRLEGKRAA